MFRMKLVPHRPGRPGSIPPPGTSPGRWMGGMGVIVVGMAVLAGWMLGHRTAKHDGLEVDGEPVIVAMRKIGQLHTAEFKLTDVMHAQTEGDSDSPLRGLPLADGVYKWATHNEALLTVEGTVEAGINLASLREQDVAKVRAPDGTSHLRIHLPPVTIYRPNVHLSVENNHPGPFWRDENLLPKAHLEAEQLFRAKAEQGNIRAQAQAGAIEQLQKIEATVGRHNIDFYF